MSRAMLCPKCRRNFPDEDGFCPFDGTPLVSASSISGSSIKRSDVLGDEEARPTSRMSVDDVEAALASGEHAAAPQSGPRVKPTGEIKPTARMSVEDVEAALASGEHAVPPGPRQRRATGDQRTTTPMPTTPSPRAAADGGFDLDPADTARDISDTEVTNRKNPTVRITPKPGQTAPAKLRSAPLPVKAPKRSTNPPPVLLSPPALKADSMPEITEEYTHLRPGSIVGEYKITGLLGHGGMTQVYAGVHPVIGKRVALKVLHAQYSSDDDLLGRFIQEAQAVNQVGSDRIVDIFGFGHLPDGRAYLLMNQVDGQPLSDLVEAGGPLATTQAHTIFMDVANGLAAAHSVGIVHRDVKPSNIMIQTDSEGVFRAKVLDFGVAKLLRTDAHAPGVSTARGTMIGTPLYMSPEQVKGEAVDARSDAYALGVTMFQALTGDVPFDVKYDMDIAIAHVEKEPRVPSSLRPNLSPEWDKLILDCLAKAPAQRPATMREVQIRLAQLGASATRGGTGYVDVPSYVDPQSLITTLSQTAVAPSPEKGRTLWPIIVAVVLGLALVGGALYYYFSQ